MQNRTSSTAKLCISDWQGPTLQGALAFEWGIEKRSKTSCQQSLARSQTLAGLNMLKHWNISKTCKTQQDQVWSFFSLPTLVSSAVSSWACLGPSNALWIPLDVVDLNRLHLCETNPCSDRWLKLWNFVICRLTHWVTQSVPMELVYYLCSTLQQKQTRRVKRVAKNVHWRVDEHRSPLALGPRLYGPNSSVAAALSSESPTKACSFLCSSSWIGWNAVSVFSSESI